MLHSHTRPSVVAADAARGRPIGTKDENLTLAQFDPNCACHRDPVGRAAECNWKARTDWGPLLIDSAIL